MPLFNETNFPKPGSTPTSSTPTNSPADRWPERPQPVYDATLAVPLKDTARVIEPYNPYPPRTRKTKSMTLEAFALYGGIAALMFAGLALVGAIVVQKFAERQISKAIHKAAAPYADIAAVNFGGVGLSLFKQTFTIRDITITLPSEETISIGSAKVWGIDFSTLKQIAMSRKPAVPNTMKFAVNNVRMNTSVFGPKEIFSQMGYTQIAFSTQADLSMSKNGFNLKNWFVDAKKMGRFNAALSLENVKLPTQAEVARFKKDPTHGIDAFSKTTIRGFSFTFEDQTITRRLVNYFEHLGETSPLMLARMALTINSGVRDPASVDFTKPALETLIQFFEKPTTLTITADPHPAVPLTSLLDDSRGGGSINDLAHQLNLSLQ